MPLDATGQDSFVYRVDDGDCSDTATINVDTDTNVPVNDCPTARDENVTLDEDQPLTGELDAEDINNDTLIYTIVASPTHGQISGFDPLTGDYTYTPNPNYYGEDTFTFHASDGVCESNTATFAITILPVNDAPVLVFPYYSLESIQAGAANPAGSTVEYILESRGANGVTDADSTGGFVPKRGMAVIGVDNTNGIWQYSLHMVDIWSDFGNDLDETSAMVLGESDRIRFIPDPDFYGEVTNGIEFRAWDQTDAATPGDTGIDTSTRRLLPPEDSLAYSADSAFASINVEKLNDCPVAQDAVYTIAEDSSLDDFVNATDADGDPLTFSIVSGVSNGQITNFNPDTGAFTYIPGENFNGTDSFTFTANDGICTSNVAMITINVTPVNDCPTAYPETYHIEENELVEDFLEGSDPDGDPLTYTIVAGPERGTVEIVNAATGEFVYTPEDYQAGTDTFTFQVDDGDCSDTAVITINITDMNICPVAYDETYVIDEDTELTSFLEGFDTDKGPESLTFEVLTDLEFGMVTYDPQTGEFTYAPNESFLGKDQFTFRVYDGECYSSPATITIYVSPATADCPAAFDEVFTVNSGSSVSGFLTAVDPEGDSLTYSITNGPSYGEISDFNPVTGSFTYAPNPNFHGVDTFTFTATDGNCISNVATISINVYQ
jgi:hypothetical protein